MDGSLFKVLKGDLLSPLHGKWRFSKANYFMPVFHLFLWNNLSLDGNWLISLNNGQKLSVVSLTFCVPSLIKRNTELKGQSLSNTWQTCYFDPTGQSFVLFWLKSWSLGVIFVRTTILKLGFGNFRTFVGQETLPDWCSDSQSFYS